MTHTPGPWKVSEGSIPLIYKPGRYGGSAGIRDGEIARVAGMGNLDAAQQRANAHLIAAAPDMLAALEDLAAAMRNVLLHHGAQMSPDDASARRATLDAALAIITRATGAAS